MDTKATRFSLQLLLCSAFLGCGVSIDESSRTDIDENISAELIDDRPIFGELIEEKDHPQDQRSLSAAEYTALMDNIYSASQTDWDVTTTKRLNALQQSDKLRLAPEQLDSVRLFFNDNHGGGEIYWNYKSSIPKALFPIQNLSAEVDSPSNAANTFIHRYGQLFRHGPDDSLSIVEMIPLVDNVSEPERFLFEYTRNYRGIPVDGEVIHIVVGSTLRSGWKVHSAISTDPEGYINLDTTTISDYDSVVKVNMVLGDIASKTGRNPSFSGGEIRIIENRARTGHVFAHFIYISIDNSYLLSIYEIPSGKLIRNIPLVAFESGQGLLTFKDVHIPQDCAARTVPVQYANIYCDQPGCSMWSCGSSDDSGHFSFDGSNHPGGTSSCQQGRYKVTKLEGPYLKSDNFINWSKLGTNKIWTDDCCPFMSCPLCAGNEIRAWYHVNWAQKYMNNIGIPINNNLTYEVNDENGCYATIDFFGLFSFHPEFGSHQSCYLGGATQFGQPKKIWYQTDNLGSNDNTVLWHEYGHVMQDYTNKFTVEFASPKYAYQEGHAYSIAGIFEKGNRLHSNLKDRSMNNPNMFPGSGLFQSMNTYYDYYRHKGVDWSDWFDDNPADVISEINADNYKRGNIFAGLNIQLMNLIGAHHTNRILWYQFKIMGNNTNYYQTDDGSWFDTGLIADWYQSLIIAARTVIPGDQTKNFIHEIDTAFIDHGYLDGMTTINGKHRYDTITNEKRLGKALFFDRNSVAIGQGEFNISNSADNYSFFAQANEIYNIDVWAKWPFTLTIQNKNENRSINNQKVYSSVRSGGVYKVVFPWWSKENKVEMMRISVTAQVPELLIIGMFDDSEYTYSLTLTKFRNKIGGNRYSKEFNSISDATPIFSRSPKDDISNYEFVTIDRIPALSHYNTYKVFIPGKDSKDTTTWDDVEFRFTPRSNYAGKKLLPSMIELTNIPYLSDPGCWRISFPNSGITKIKYPRRCVADDFMYIIVSYFGSDRSGPEYEFYVMDNGYNRSHYNDPKSISNFHKYAQNGHLASRMVVDLDEGKYFDFDFYEFTAMENHGYSIEVKPVTAGCNGLSIDLDSNEKDECGRNKLDTEILGTCSDNFACDDEYLYDEAERSQEQPHLMDDSKYNATVNNRHFAECRYWDDYHASTLPFRNVCGPIDRGFLFDRWNSDRNRRAWYRSETTDLAIHRARPMRIKFVAPFSGRYKVRVAMDSNGPRCGDGTLNCGRRFECGYLFSIISDGGSTGANRTALPEFNAWR